MWLCFLTCMHILSNLHVNTRTLDNQKEMHVDTRTLEKSKALNYREHLVVLSGTDAFSGEETLSILNCLPKEKRSDLNRLKKMLPLGENAFLLQ